MQQMNHRFVTRSASRLPCRGSETGAAPVRAAKRVRQCEAQSAILIGTMRACRLCGKQTKRLRCGSCNTKIRRYRVRTAAIQYLGGACIKCGWNKHPAGFDFHHRDPGTKDFQISSKANMSWKVVRAELDKCDLLCALCHRLLHGSSEAVYAEVRNYRGGVLPLD